MSAPYLPPPPDHDSHPEERISPEVVEILRGTRIWPLVIAVITFINTALSAFQIFKPGSRLLDINPAGVAGAAFVLILNIFLGLKLLGYANNIGRLVKSGSQADFEAALGEHRKYWKTIGILVTIFLVFFGLVVLFGLLAGAARR